MTTGENTRQTTLGEYGFAFSKARQRTTRQETLEASGFAFPAREAIMIHCKQCGRIQDGEESHDFTVICMYCGVEAED